MRKMSWGAVALVLALGAVLAGCSGSSDFGQTGPSRGSNTQPSASSNLFVQVTASPNTLRGATVGTQEQQGGCAAIQVKVSNTQGQVVDGATVTITTTLGRFPQTATRPESVGVFGFTTRGVYTDVLCAKGERGTAIVTATVEDAVDTVLITIF